MDSVFFIALVTRRSARCGRLSGDRFFVQGLTVEGQFTGSVCGQAVDRDVINGLSVAIMNLVAGPACRKTRSDSQAIALEMDAEQCFCEESVHPAG